MLEIDLNLLLTRCFGQVKACNDKNKKHHLHAKQARTSKQCSVAHILQYVQEKHLVTRLQLILQVVETESGYTVVQVSSSPQENLPTVNHLMFATF